MTTKETRKQLWLFLLLCFSLTGIFMFCINRLDSTMVDVKAQALYVIVCFCPAIAALVVGLVCKVRLREYGLLPHLDKNVRVYVFAVLFAICIALIDDPLRALCFPQVMHFENVDMVMLVFQILFMIMSSVMAFFVLLGEEIGWLGFLFPRLESLHGTVFAVITMGVVRGLWHLPLMLGMNMEHLLVPLLTLIASNILLGSVLVYVTKKSGSIIPATIMHSLENGLAGVYGTYLVINESAMMKYDMALEMVSLIPMVIFGCIGFALLLSWKRRQFN